MLSLKILVPTNRRTKLQLLPAAEVSTMSAQKFLDREQIISDMVQPDSLGAQPHLGGGQSPNTTLWSQIAVCIHYSLAIFCPSSLWSLLPPSNYGIGTPAAEIWLSASAWRRAKLSTTPLDSLPRKSPIPSSDVIRIPCWCDV